MEFAKPVSQNIKDAYSEVQTKDAEHQQNNPKPTPEPVDNTQMMNDISAAINRLKR